MALADEQLLIWKRLCRAVRKSEADQTPYQPDTLPGPPGGVVVKVVSAAVAVTTTTTTTTSSTSSTSTTTTTSGVPLTQYLYPGVFVVKDVTGVTTTTVYYETEACYVDDLAGGGLEVGRYYTGDVIGEYRGLAIVAVGSAGVVANEWEFLRVAAAATTGPGGVKYYPTRRQLFDETDGTWSDEALQDSWLIQQQNATLTSDGTATYSARIMRNGIPAGYGMTDYPVYCTTETRNLTNWQCIDGVPVLTYST